MDEHPTESNSVRVVDVFVDELDPGKLGFDGINPAETGRPSYHPFGLLKIYIYGYLNRIQSRRRLEWEAQRNIELMWLTIRRSAPLQRADICLNRAPWDIAIKATPCAEVR